MGTSNNVPEKVLVVGDVIIDKYTHGTRLGISAETPTLVASMDYEEMFVGGAGLVVRNLLRLGCEVMLFTVGDEDTELHNLFKQCSDPITPAERARLHIEQFRHGTWKYTEKRRYFVEQYKMLQYDILNKGKWESVGEQNFVKSLQAYKNWADAIVICDNRHGVMTENIAREILKLATSAGTNVYVDSQVSQKAPNHEWYAGADFMFLNEKEVESLKHYLPDRSKKKCSDGVSTCVELSKMLETNIVFKQGAAGSTFISRIDLRCTQYNPYKVEAVDTCGAGDAFLAAFVSSYGDQKFANEWAALSTTYKGTFVPVKGEK